MPSAFRHEIAQPLPPTVLTIFGATGDLSANYLLPALFHLDTQKLLPNDFHLVCVGRRDFNDESFLDFIVRKSRSLKKLANPKARKHFLKHLTYYKGDFDKPETFKPLADQLADREQPKHVCYNRLYYFATSPQYFSGIASLLEDSGLLMACEAHERKVRVLVEKPFGFNLQSAQDLNHLLLKYFSEEQLYRIDHYQGKETVQNLMVVRFANSIFEPLWNKEFIDHIEISVLEKEGVGSRAPYYESSGALKDMVQNHILQMLALIAMDEPKDMSAESIRDAKVKVLDNLIPFDVARAIGLPVGADIIRPQGGKMLSSPTSNPSSGGQKPWLIRGQYQSYASEVGHQTTTETFVALKAFVNNERWQGVPFYVRTGKNLSQKVAEVSVHFKEPVKCLFEGCGANVLTFRIQPDESVHVQINNKIPGFGIRLHRADLDFSYLKTFSGEIPSAYERLLLDFLQGDQRLFIRSDEIEAAWKFIDSITNSWDKLPLYTYQSGSNGPAESDEQMQQDLRQWWTK